MGSSMAWDDEPPPVPRLATLEPPDSPDAAELSRLEYLGLLAHKQTPCAHCEHLQIGRFRRAFCPIEDKTVSFPDQPRNCTRVQVLPQFRDDYLLE